MLLIMNKRRFISFHKHTHGVPVAGWNSIPITTTDSCEGSIKRNK